MSRVSGHHAEPDRFTMTKVSNIDLAGGIYR